MARHFFGRGQNTRLGLVFVATETAALQPSELGKAPFPMHFARIQ
jgi:hypothetical protein